MVLRHQRCEEVAINEITGNPGLIIDHSADLPCSTGGRVGTPDHPSRELCLEYGWLNEPPISGQPNAVVVNISENIPSGSSPTPSGNSTQDAETPAIDVTGLKIAAVNGECKKD